MTNINDVKKCKEGLLFMLDYAKTQDSNEDFHFGDCTNDPNPCQKCWWLENIEIITKTISILDKLIAGELKERRDEDKV